MTVDGFLNVDKPSGWTSFDVVAFVRRETNVRRVGHAGTLDPAAQGVLVLALGQATRFLEFLLEAPKSYRATVRLGIATDTYDAEGEVVATADPSSVTRKMVEDALAGFRGVVEQTPPMFSAIKRHGVPLYRLARAKREVEREARPVEVHRLELVDFTPPSLTLEVECGHGFYVRSLADDLGRQLGCGAHLEALSRTSVGPFQRGSSIGIEALREVFRAGSWQELLLPLDSVLLHLCAAIIGEHNKGELRFGRALSLRPAVEERVSALPPGTPCRAYSLDGRLLGLLTYAENAVWQPQKVLSGL